MKLLIFLLLTLPINAQEFLIGEGLSQSMITIDWKQTIENHSKYPGHVEANPILGKHPSKLKISLYFSSIMVSHFIISKKLPKHWRYALWGATIALQAKVIYDNSKGGIKYGNP